MPRFGFLRELRAVLGLSLVKELERAWTHIHVLRIVGLSPSFIPRTLRARRVSTIEDRFIVEARLYADLSECPTCGQPSRRIHSTYVRTVRDLPTSAADR